jgi:multimeric flavodoxin WrbA
MTAHGKAPLEVLILDGSAGETPACRHLTTLAERMGARVSRYPLADLRLAPCLGDFECWTKTPGLCRTRDEAQEIARAMHQASLVIFLTPVVFGGYSADLKKAVDRLISLAHPDFRERDGLTRHEPRYTRYAPMLFIGLSDAADDEAAGIFREIATGNAINLMAPCFRSLVVSQASGHWQHDIESALFAALGDAPGEPFTLPAADALALACAPDETGADPQPPRRVAVFIGSARAKGTSTSESLAQPLLARLHAAGVETSVVYASQFIKPGRATETALATMLAADLLVVSSPVYVDGLPSLVSRALEQLAETLAQRPHALARVAGILNCGYPESVHNHLALRLLRCFSHQNGLRWAGGLGMGGGEIVHGKPLNSMRLFLRHPIRALRLAGDALAAGQPVPAKAAELMGRQLVPAWLFRWIARLRWILQARPNGINHQQLGARPHEAS